MFACHSNFDFVSLVYYKTGMVYISHRISWAVGKPFSENRLIKVCKSKTTLSIYDFHWNINKHRSILRFDALHR